MHSQQNAFPSSSLLSNLYSLKIKTFTTLKSSISPSLYDFAVATSISPLKKMFRATLINAALFLLLRSNLKKMLTSSGFWNALLLGSGLWSTLGWKGWSVCVAYLFMGQIVTKVGFEQKESAGISKGRDGRRGPENVWQV